MKQFKSRSNGVVFDISILLPRFSARAVLRLGVVTLMVFTFIAGRSLFGPLSFDRPVEVNMDRFTFL